MPSLTKRIFKKFPVSRSTRAYEFALSKIDLPKAATLLDIGAGQGYGSGFLSRTIPQGQVIGIDITYECAEGEKPEFGFNPPIFIQANAPQLPFIKNSFDAVFAVMTFHCLPNPEQFLSEAWRILKPGGVLVIADVNGNHPLALAFEWFEHLFISPLTIAWKKDELRNSAGKVGFSSIRVENRPGQENGFMQWMIATKNKD